MTFDDVRKIALAWPEVEDGSSYGTPALKVRKKLLARLREDNESLVMLGVTSALVGVGLITNTKPGAETAGWVMAGLGTATWIGGAVVLRLNERRSKRRDVSY